MSGGSFNYAYSRVLQFADDLGTRLKEADYVDDYGGKPNEVTPEAYAKLRDIEKAARYMAEFMREVEWLYSGDTDDDIFLNRVREIEALTRSPADRARRADDKLLTETRESVTFPADYSFASVNDFVHGVEVHFEELQWLCLGMATEIERLRARVEMSPVAVMDTRDVLGICAPNEEDFPALYALQGKRVRLVLDDVTQNANRLAALSPVRLSDVLCFFA